MNILERIKADIARRQQKEMSDMKNQQALFVSVGDAGTGSIATINGENFPEISATQAAKKMKKIIKDWKSYSDVVIPIKERIVITTNNQEVKVELETFLASLG